MEYLTVKEYAELKECQPRYIQKLLKDGKIAAERRPHPQNKQMCYMIPISELSEDMQIKYYNKLRCETGIPLPRCETAIKQHKKAVSKTFEEMTEEERREANTWSEIVSEWLNIRGQYKNKAQADSLYVGKCQLEHPEMKISRDILYRKLKAYRAGNEYGLIDKRGAWNRKSSSIHPIIWEAFLYYWLDDNKPTAAKCYESTINWAEEFYPELSGDIPTLRTFRRHILSEIPKAVEILMREGEKAFSDRCMPYIIRMYDDMNANDCWIADNHTLDIQSIDDENNIHRLYITTFMDAKSGVITGWNITDTVNSQSTLLALRHGIDRFGIPKCVYFDNGREFLTHDIGGRGHRGKKLDAPDPETVLQRLGIEMRNAIVRNAKAKPIERTFSTLKMRFSKLFSGFCGGTILERPESLKRRVKNGELPMDHEVRKHISLWIDGDYNVMQYGGGEAKFKGLTRIDVWNKSIMQIRQANDTVLNLLLMRSTRFQKVKRNGVFVDIYGERLWYMDTKETVLNLERVVAVRYDPADLTSVRIYDEEDRYLFTWQLADALMVDYLTESKEQIADGMKLTKNTRRFVKDTAKGMTAGLTNEQRITMLDMSIRKAEQNRNEKFRIELPKNIIPVTVNEPLPEQEKKAAGAENTVVIDLDKMRRNAEMRKKD